MVKNDRKLLDETLVNMFSNNDYKTNLMFYAHMFSQMEIEITDRIPAPAGVAFITDHFKLYINNEYFGEYSLEDRMFILVHECLHILMDHVKRFEAYKEQHFQDLQNIAMDCAINQLIPSLPIPESAIVPSNLPVKDNAKVPKKASAETYYELLKDEYDKQDDSQDNSQDNKDDSQDNGDQGEDSNEDNNQDDTSGNDGNQKDSKPKPKQIDTHETWQECDADPQLQKDVTKRMIEQAIQETSKSRGDLPLSITDMLNMFCTKPQVNWKKVLKNIVGHRKVGKRPTIMKRSRRFPSRSDIKGTTKNRSFTLVVLVDISGSMATNEILTGLSEINAICKLTKTTMKMIQIDTQVHKIEEFSEKTRLFERSGCGGTVMEAGIDYLYDNKIEYDGIVYITDGYIEDVSDWKRQPHGRVMWLCTTPNHIIPGVDKLQKHKQFDINV